jgi:hypothetical protein
MPDEVIERGRRVLNGRDLLDRLVPGCATQTDAESTPSSMAIKTSSHKVLGPHGSARLAATTGATIPTPPSSLN